MTQTWIVDGNNVVGSRPDGWWRDRPGAAARLVDEVARLVLDRRAWPEAGPILIVFDGPPPDAGLDRAGVVVMHAGSGRSADDAIVDRVAEQSREGSTPMVVTSDRVLAQRVREIGAAVTPSRRFLDRLEAAR